MIINQNFNACSKLLNLDVICESLSFAKLSRVLLNCRLFVGFFLLFSSAEAMMAAPRDTQNNDESSKTQQVDSSKSSSEAVGVNMDDNIRLRRALDEYSRSVDPAHVQIEERRRVMHKRLQERFSQTDRDNDGAISLEEAYDSMPQLARHFGAVDLNSDHFISLDELEALQVRIVERQRIASAKSDSPDVENVKQKNKQSGANNRKNSL